MKVLSLDLSSKKSGYALFDTKENKIIDYGVWRFEDTGNWRDRIVWMGGQLKQYLQTHEITNIIIEDVPPVLDNSQTVKILSALQGCILAITVMYDISVEFVSVRTWKQVIGIDLTHSKEFLRLKKEKPAVGKAIAKEVKAHEKILSIENANRYIDRQLVYNGPTSKKTEDDIADAINIVLYYIYKEGAKYQGKNFEDILQEISIQRF